MADHHHGFRIGFAVQGREQVVHAVLGHVGDGLARRRTPVQRIGVLEHPVARVVGFEIVLRDGVDLTPGAFAQHASLPRWDAVAIVAAVSRVRTYGETR